MNRLPIGRIREAIAVNRNVLEEEAEIQPILLHDIGEHYLDAVEVRDQAKMTLSQTEWQVADQLRVQWGNVQGGVKFSEAKLVSAVQLDHRVKAAATLVRQKTMETLRIQNLQEVVRRRGDVISQLVSLYGSQYFTVRR